MKLSFWDLLEKDIARFLDINPNDTKKINFLIFRYFCTTSSFRSIFFYRLLKLNFIKKHTFVQFFIIFWARILTNIEIGLNAEIGEGILIPHPYCVIIGDGSIIGNNVTIHQGVTIGDNMFKTRNGRTSPIIEDNVLICAGAKVIGPIVIGKNCVIGANAVVIKDIPMNSVAVGVPAKVIKEVKESYPDMIRRHIKMEY